MQNNLIMTTLFCSHLLHALCPEYLPPQALESLGAQRQFQQGSLAFTCAEYESQALQTALNEGSLQSVWLTKEAGNKKYPVCTYSWQSETNAIISKNSAKKLDIKSPITITSNNTLVLLGSHFMKSNKSGFYSNSP